jgi:flagellar hook-associated protein 1
MLQYQHGYDAAARFLTAVDQTLDTLINSTGIVGRT